jgi:glucosamine-6-phosphate deaminase
MESGLFKMFEVEKLKVIITSNRKEMGKCSAKNVGNLIKELLYHSKEIRMIFAAAPSQDEFLSELTGDKSIEWSRIIAFHMDEYIGLPKGSNQLFSKYLDDHLFSKVNFKKVNIINSQVENIDEECIQYDKLLKEEPIDIVCMGIGENGHIAFNDPPVADFEDERFVKIVELEQKCKQQQVNDGCFKNIDEVPKTAITLTVPALFSGTYLNVVVPGTRKAEAVKITLTGKISTQCPATIIRKHDNAILYIDKDSSSLLENN